MKISKEDLLRVNRGFDGNLRIGSSLAYAIDKQKNKKLGEYKKLAYLWRAILVGNHKDGSKRTAAFVAMAFAEEHNKQVNRDLLLHHIVSIAKQNITNIRQIEYRLKNAIR